MGSVASYTPQPFAIWPSNASGFATPQGPLASQKPDLFQSVNPHSKTGVGSDHFTISPDVVPWESLNIGQKFACTIIHGWQVLSQATLYKWLGHSVCVMSPTCSHYGYEAIQRHGLLKGSQLTLSRIFRCAAVSTRSDLDPNDPVPLVLHPANTPSLPGGSGRIMGGVAQGNPAY